MKILIAYDGSKFANAILDDLRYAGLPPRAEVAVISLAEPEYFLVGKKTDNVVGWLGCRLIEARLSARFAGDRIRADFPGWDVTFEGRLAPPPEEIIRKVAQWNPNLVIIGQHGRDASKRAGLGRVAKRLFKDAMNFFERVFRGGVVASVASRAECSVEIVRPPVRRNAVNSEFTAMTARRQSSAARR